MPTFSQMVWDTAIAMVIASDAQYYAGIVWKYFAPVLIGFIVWFAQFVINRRNTARVEAARVAAVKKLGEEQLAREGIARQHQEVLDRLAALEETGNEDATAFALLKHDMMPVSEFMKRKAIEALEHPSEEFEIPDALLNQIKPVGASMPPELLPLLKERAHSTSPHVDEMEKLYAEALPIMVRLAELEAQEAEQAPDKVITSMQLVSSTQKTPAMKKRDEEAHNAKANSDAPE